MREIALNRGQVVALVDDDDFEFLNQWKWSRSGKYASRYQYREGDTQERRNRTLIYMHRLIAGTPEGLFTDHVNGNKLDNRRVNLRVCTRSQNIANTAPKGATGLKGVGMRRDKWYAQITVNRKRIFLGDFATKNEAARAYDSAARLHFGEFARLNNI